MCVLITCEAGGAKVPAVLLPTENQSIVGLTEPSADEAAFYAAHRLSNRLKVPLIQYEFSLQAIDVTRSLHHPKLFSPKSRSLDAAGRQQLIDDCYMPYRAAVRQTLEQLMRRNRYVLHLSIRSFDLLGPKNKPRRADVGLLYDPASKNESDLCADWLEELYFDWDMLKVRRNYPRRGTVDSLTKSMRSEFDDDAFRGKYLGVEVLLNRAWASRSIPIRDLAIDAIGETLQAVMQLQQRQAA